MTLLANLLALPAVAPVMWLGMLRAPPPARSPRSRRAAERARSLLLAYIAQVAPWFGAPAGPSSRSTSAARPGALRGAGGRSPARSSLGGSRLAAARAIGDSWPAAPVLVAVGARAVALALRWPPAGLAARSSPWRAAGRGPRRRPGRRDPAPPARGAGGPGRRRPARRRPRRAAREAGVERLGAAIVTHDQSDHAGGIAELLGRLPVDRLALRAAAAATCSRRRRAAGAAPVRVAAGTRLRSGAPAARGPLAAAGAARGAAAGRRPEPLRWSCSPAGATSRCCSPPTPRPRRCRSTPARSTCSRSPTTAATTRAWRAARAHPARVWR